MADNISEQDRGAQLENQFNSAYDKLENALGENKDEAATFLNAARVIDRTIDRVFDEMRVPQENRSHHRKEKLRAGINDFIVDSNTGRDLQNHAGSEYREKVANLVNLTEDLFDARQAYATYQRQNRN